MNSAEILERCWHEYHQCKTYSDDGRVVKRLGQFDDYESSFRTLYQRPASFLFEWTDGDNRHLIRCLDHAVTITSGCDVPCKSASVNDAFAEMAGVTGRSAENILPMLLGDRSGSILALEQFVVVDQSPLHYILRGQRSSSESLTIYIKRDSYLIGTITTEQSLSEQIQAEIWESGSQTLIQLRAEGKISSERFQEFWEVHERLKEPASELLMQTTFQFKNVKIDEDDCLAEPIANSGFILGAS